MPLVLGLVCFLVYNANLRVIGAGDTVPARYLPLVLWHGGSLELSANAPLIAQGHSLNRVHNRPVDTGGKVAYLEPAAYWMIHTREHELASFYPVVTPLLVTPLYLPAAIWLDAHGWEQPQVNRVAELMEKLAASILAALAGVLVYLVLRREGHRWSLPLALAFAFGTNTWMISSQALWQHGVGEVLIALALLLTLAAATPARMALLGALCVLIAANRPPDALIAAAFGLFVVCRRWRDAVWLVAGAAVPLAALLYYNLGFIGRLSGGYDMVPVPKNFIHHDWSGLAGVLVSPTRGLLVFSPFLAFVPLGLIRRLRSPERGLAVALCLAVAAQIALYSLVDWRAGVCWGPRYLTDILPILVWMIAPAPPTLRPFARGLFIAAIIASVGVQAVGAFWYTKTSDEIIYGGDSASMRAAWDPANIPFLVELRHPPARGELLCDATGSIDRVGQSVLPAPANKLPELEPGAVLEGWALACGRTPAQLAVLIDGILLGSTTNFLPRADVNAAMHAHAPSGWRMFANLWGVAPGERVLQLAVRIEPRSEFRIVREQRVFVVAQPPVAKADAKPPPPLSASALDAMAARAAALLREHQTAYGAWLTSHTKKPSYEAPQPEMNTFTTSMLVDLLAPVAQRQNLDAALASAHAHLAAQIESDGLVRYHGLPDGPTIGTLGCAITPDADDTALVWRIAGNAEDPRRQDMLRTLARYRDARGFYRTWLAPQKQYRCLDPGLDPNPADVVIQMHVYMLLREFDPPAARELCGALQHSFHDNYFWAYYARSPLLPYLRAAELQQLGCALALPAERLALPVAGQEIWSEAAQRLVETTASAQGADARQAARGLLAQLGDDDFALLRRAPPLLYHNDLLATVPRYYWSEDVGYALWLRLYEAAGFDVEGRPRDPASP